MAVDLDKLKDAFNKATPSLDTISERAEEEQGNILWENVGKAVYDWADGAVKGMQELTRAGNYRAEADPQAFMGNDPFTHNQISIETKAQREEEAQASAPPADTEPPQDTQELGEASIKEEPRQLTDEQVESAEWYKKAVRNYTDETIKPAVIAGTIFMMPVEGAGIKALSAISTYPLLMDMGIENLKKYGMLEGAKETAGSLFIPKATYEAFTSDDPLMKAYRERLPLRTFLANASMDLMMMHPAMSKATGLYMRLRADQLRKKHANATEAEIAEMLRKEQEQADKPIEEQIENAIKEQEKPKEGEDAKEQPKSEEETKVDPNLTVEDVIAEEEAKTEQRAIGDVTIDALDNIINSKETSGIIREDTYDRVAEFVLSNEGLASKLLNGNVKPVIKAVRTKFGIDDVKAAKVLKTIYTGEHEEVKVGDVAREAFVGGEDTPEDIQAMRKPNNKAEEMNNANKPEVQENLDRIGKQAEAEAKIKEEAQAETKRVAEEELTQSYKGVNGEVKPSTSNITDRVDWQDAWHTAKSFTDVKQSTIKKVKGVLGYFSTKDKAIKVKGHQSLDTLTHELGHFSNSVLKIKAAKDSLLEITRSIFGQSEFESPYPFEKKFMSFLREYATDKQKAKANDSKSFKTLEDAIAKDAKLKEKVDKLTTQLEVDAELENACVKIFGSAYKPEERRGEGIAEFFHELLYNPEQAEKDYPKFFAEYSKAIAEHPELAKKLDLLGNQVRKILSQHGYEAGRAAQETTEDVKRRQTEGMTSLDKALYKIADAGDKYRETMLDEFTKVRDLMQAWQERTGIKLPSYANIADFMQACRSTVPARLAMILGTSPLRTELAMKALSQVCGGIKLYAVTFKDVLDSLKHSYKIGEISNDFLDLCGKKGGKRATVYEAFMTFVNAMSNYDIIKLKNNEAIAKSEAQLAHNAHKRASILKGYDKQFRSLDKQVGRMVQQLMNVSPTEMTKTINKMADILNKEKERLLKKFANDSVNTKDIEEAFNKKIQDLNDKLAEVLGQISTMSVEEIANTYHGKKITERVRNRQNKRDEAIVDKDIAIRQREQRVLNTNAEKGKYIAESIDAVEMRIEDLITALYEKAVKYHTKGVNAEINRLNQEIAKLTQKLAQDKRLTDLATSDTLETTNINEIRAGNRDYVTNIKHKNDMGNDDIREIIRLAPKSFFRTEKLLRRYNANLLELSVYFGFFDRATVNNFKKDRPHYIPSERSFSEENAAYQDIHNFMAKLSKEGSDRTVKDPLMAIQNRTEALLTRGYRNMIKRAWTGFAHAEQDTNKLVTWLPEANPEAQNARGVFDVYINGKKQWYQAHDEIVYDAITHMDAESSALYNNILGAASRAVASTLRITATQTPAFMVWNMLRDTLTASVNSQTNKAIANGKENDQLTTNRAIPIFDTIQGFAKMTDNIITRHLRSKEMQDKLDMSYAQFYAQGVPFATRIGSNTKVTKQWMNYIQSAKGQTMVQKSWDVAKKAWGAYTSVGERIEQAPRYQEFLRTLQQGGSIFEAGQRARDITTNFSRHGTLSKSINQYVPFFNATMQGTQTMYRAWSRDKMGFTMKACGFVTAPTILLWAINHNQEWYRNLPASERDKNWFFKIGDTIYRYPKPELLGYIFGTIPEMMLNAADGDTRAFKDTQIGSLMRDSMLPMGMPTAILAIEQWRANYDFYRQRNIVPQNMLKLPVEEQYTNYTSGIAIKAGQLTGQSPMLIDSTMRTVLSSMGSTALGVSDLFTKDEQNPDRPFTEKMRFFYNTHGKTRTQDVFRERYNNMEKQANSRYYHKGKDPNFDKNWRIMKEAHDKVNKGWGAYNKMRLLEVSDDVKRSKMNTQREKIETIMRTANSRTGYKYIQAPK